MENVQNVQSKLKSNIERKLSKSQEKMQAIVGKLQEEITELQRKDTQLQELSQNQDSLRMLQVSSSSRAPTHELCN